MSDRIDELVQDGGCSSMSDTKFFDIVFDGPPSHEAGRFVETEDSNRRSVCLGEWVERDDGYWVLRIPAVGDALKMDDDEPEKFRLRAERDALLAEHDAVAALKRFVLENAADVYSSPRTEVLATCMENAHDNVERVIHGE